MSIIDELAQQLANFPTNRRINIGPSNTNNTANNTTNMVLPQIHVRDYLDLIPSFDGNPTKLSTFIKACESVLPLMAPGSEPERITFTMLHIRTKLVGKAAALTAARNFVTFPDLKTILISLFGDQRNEESLLSDLNTLRQKSNESPHQFADRCVDIRCLLLSKLSCENVQEVVKNAKINMYNSFTLRAFITGVNPQLSHILRCRNPATIEEAIQIVTEEENINYHRTKIGATSQNKPPVKPTYQLRVNAPQIRQPTFTPPGPSQQVNRPPPPVQQKWTPRPFPTVKHPFFQQQNHAQRFQASGSSQQPKPTPMEVDSNRTRLSNQSIRTNRPRLIFEELTTQEVTPDYQDYENTEESEYYEPENYENYENQEGDPAVNDENFPTPASNTSNTKQ